MNADNTMKPTVKPSKHDWSRFDAMSEAQRHARSRARSRAVHAFIAIKACTPASVGT